MLKPWKPNLWDTIETAAEDIELELCVKLISRGVEQSRIIEDEEAEERYNWQKKRND